VDDRNPRKNTSIKIATARKRLRQRKEQNHEPRNDSNASTESGLACRRGESAARQFLLGKLILLCQFDLWAVGNRSNELPSLPTQAANRLKLGNISIGAGRFCHRLLRFESPDRQVTK
jgi:hypothetical protein